MKKSEYLVPEMSIVLLKTESMLCASGSFEPFDSDVTDFPMFVSPVFDVLL